jgi:hypothetical protein
MSKVVFMTKIQLDLKTGQSKIFNLSIPLVYGIITFTISALVFVFSSLVTATTADIADIDHPTISTRMIELATVNLPMSLAGCSVDPSTLTAPGCSLMRNDTAMLSNPDSLWGSTDCVSSSRHELLYGDSDSHVTSTGSTQNNDSYRELRVIDGDDFYGERCELGRNERRYGENGGSGTFALYQEGQHRITFISYRLPDTFPLSTTTWQVVTQMKQTQPSNNAGGTPVISLEVRDTKWTLVQSTSAGVGEDTRILWSAPASRNTWTRFAFDMIYSSDSSRGSIKVYVDLNNDGDALDVNEQSPVIQTYTQKYETSPSSIGLTAGDTIPSHLRIGLYHNPTISCPPPNGCSVQFDNIQVVEESNTSPTPTPMPSPATPTPTPSPVTIIRVNSINSTFVRDGQYANTTYGSSVELQVKKSTTDYNRWSYLKFDLSSVNKIISVKLRLYGKLSSTQDSSVPTAIYSCSNTSWNGSTIAWNNKPVIGTTALTTTKIRDTTARWYEWDVTSYLKTERAARRNLITLVLKNPNSSSAVTIFNSDNAAINKPQLVITQ